MQVHQLPISFLMMEVGKVIFEPKIPCSNTRRAPLSPLHLNAIVQKELSDGRSFVKLHPKWVERDTAHHLQQQKIPVEVNRSSVVIQTHGGWEQVTVQSFGFPVELENGIVVENTILTNKIINIEPNHGSFLHSYDGKPIGFYIGKTENQYVFIQIDPDHEENLVNFDPENVHKRVQEEVQSLLNDVRRDSMKHIGKKKDLDDIEASRLIDNFTEAVESGDREKIKQIMRGHHDRE